MREIGRIERLQVQLGRLKKGEKTDQVYDPGALRLVPALRLTAQGVVGLADGDEWLDVHHADHPASNRKASAISFNFTSHYARMQERFGPRVAIGCAGENILIATDEIFDLADLARGIVVQTEDGQGRFAGIAVAHPCRPFSRYVLQQDRPADETLKATLQFLDGGTRGFYCDWDGPSLVVRPGDRVFVGE